MNKRHAVFVAAASMFFALTARTANATVTTSDTCTVITSLPFSPTAGGSYCLSATYAPYTYSPTAGYGAAITVDLTGADVYIDLAGLTINCAAGNTYCNGTTSGVYVHAANSVVIRNGGIAGFNIDVYGYSVSRHLKVTDVDLYGYGSGGGNDSGIYVDGGVDTLTVDRTTFRNLQYGVDCYNGPPYANIKNSQFFGTYYGYYLYGTGSSVSQFHELLSNVFTNNENAIYVVGTTATYTRVSYANNQFLATILANATCSGTCGLNGDGNNSH